MPEVRELIASPSREVFGDPVGLSWVVQEVRSGTRRPLGVNAFCRLAANGVVLCIARQVAFIDEMFQEEAPHPGDQAWWYQSWLSYGQA